MNDNNELNLTTHRAPASVWDRRGWDGTRERLAMTRWLLGIGGGALALQGVRQKSMTGGLLAGIGGSLAWYALSGEGDLSEARRRLTHLAERVGMATRTISCTTRRPTRSRPAMPRRGRRRSAPVSARGCGSADVLRAFRIPLTWPDMLKRTAVEVMADNCLGLAAQLAYYFFLALFPALLFLVAVISFMPVSGLLDAITGDARPRRARRGAVDRPGPDPEDRERQEHRAPDPRHARHDLELLVRA